MGMDSLKTRSVKVCDGLTVIAHGVQAENKKDGQVLVNISHDGKHQYSFSIPRHEVLPFCWMLQNAKDDIK